MNAKYLLVYCRSTPSNGLLMKQYYKTLSVDSQEQSQFFTTLLYLAVNTAAPRRIFDMQCGFQQSRKPHINLWIYLFIFTACCVKKNKSFRADVDMLSGSTARRCSNVNKNNLEAGKKLSRAAATTNGMLCMNFLNFV